MIVLVSNFSRKDSDWSLVPEIAESDTKIKLVVELDVMMEIIMWLRSNCFEGWIRASFNQLDNDPNSINGKQQTLYCSRKELIIRKISAKNDLDLFSYKFCKMSLLTISYFNSKGDVYYKIQTKFDVTNDWGVKKTACKIRDKGHRSNPSPFDFQSAFSFGFESWLLLQKQDLNIQKSIRKMDVCMAR